MFLHLASPFHFNVTDVEKELLLPAVDGTKNVLQAIYNFGNNIEKVVITSSYAAISTASKEADKMQLLQKRIGMKSVGKMLYLIQLMDIVDPKNLLKSCLGFYKI